MRGKVRKSAKFPKITFPYIYYKTAHGYILGTVLGVYIVVRRCAQSCAGVPSCAQMPAEVHVCIQICVVSVKTYA